LAALKRRDKSQMHPSLNRQMKVEVPSGCV
jgi:hypothetical protein